jgi:hypothetical protein
MYDAQIGRFHTQDRFAEKYFSLNPYQYVGNNPIMNIDVNGDSIKNGYQNDLDNINGRVNEIENILNNENSSKDVKKVASKQLKIAKRNQKEIQKMYDNTNMTIGLLQAIDSQLFNEINSISNADGTETDVYVKAIMQNPTNPIEGTTNVDQDPDNENQYISRYGVNTVSVTVQAGNFLKLAHEFGHVKYQVPNLASYIVYYKEKYGVDYKGIEKGHLPGDESGEMVNTVMTRFYSEYNEYKRNH